MTKQNAGIIRNVARLVINDFVTRIEQCPQGQIECFRNAHANQDFGIRVITDAAPSPDILCHRLPQLGCSQVRGVSGFPFLHGEDGSLPDPPRGDVIRFSDPEGNDVGHRLDHFEKIPNSRAWDFEDPISDVF